jgi:hypothetical protein
MATDRETMAPFQLPPGLRLIERLAPRNTDGKTKPYAVWLVEDVRVSTDAPARRAARFLRLGDLDASTLDQVRKRTVQLLGSPTPYVSLPREAGETSDGWLFIIEDYLSPCVSKDIKHGEGIPRERVRRFARHLLTGLAGLHAKRIAHGDVRPANVLLSSDKDPDRAEAWLADSVVGGLRHWNRCSRGDDAACYYRSTPVGPEPEPADDLFALGLTLAEMAGGWQANPIRRRSGSTSDEADGDAEGTSLGEQVLARLSDRPRDRALEELIRALLDTEDPLADAGAALRRLDKAERRDVQRRLLTHPGTIAVAVIGILLAVTLVGLWWKERGGRLARESDVTRLEASLEESKRVSQQAAEKLAKRDEALANQIEESQELERSLRDVIAAKDRRIVELERQIAGIRAAQDAWRGAVEVNKRFNLAQLDALETVAQANEPDIREQMLAWLLEVRPLFYEAKRYFSKGSQVDKLYIGIVRRPWETKPKQELRTLLDTLQAAERKKQIETAARQVWAKWAKSNLSDLKFDDLSHRLEGEEDPQVRDLLKKWLGQCSGTETYTLRLLSGTAPPGLGTNRNLEVEADSTGETGDHAWSSATAHTYLRGVRQFKVEFRWRPDTSIQLTFEGEWKIVRAGARRNLIDGVDGLFDGPLALWKLHDEGKITADGVTLNLEIENCPGPTPTRLRQSTKPPRKPIPGDLLPGLHLN